MVDEKFEEIQKELRQPIDLTFKKTGRLFKFREPRQPTELTIKQTRRELGTRRRLEKEERKGRGILSIIKRRRSISGRIGSAIESGFKLGRKGLTRTLIERDQPRRQISRVTRISKAGGVRTGKRGRPKGTVTFQDPRTGAPIGVFQHRKILAQQRKLQLIQARKQAAVTPRQQVVLRQLEERDRRQLMSAERRVIPGTGGQVNIMGIMDEIDSASHIFD